MDEKETEPMYFLTVLSLIWRHLFPDWTWQGERGDKAALDLTPQLIISFKALIVKHLIRYSQIVNIYTDMEKT